MAGFYRIQERFVVPRSQQAPRFIESNRLGHDGLQRILIRMIARKQDF
jgi:hypothetical protein